ncbi:MAG: hypothetical protein QOJ83_3210 [Frankiales bacterium]|jgi:hypothetical protein|nr:hypothetical protein [Frankiales bacterium]
MQPAAVRGNWRAWQWAVWMVALAAAVMLVGLASVLLYTFVGVCGAFDNPIPRPVHELQALLAGIIVVGIASWVVVAWLSGRWWRLAAASAAATVALPTWLLLTHLTVASWASVGFCVM